MRFYETLYIVDANLENKVLEKAMEDIGKELEKTREKLVQLLNIRSVIVQFFEQIFRFAGSIYQYSVFKDFRKV